MKVAAELEEDLAPPAYASLDGRLASLRSRIGADTILLSNSSGSMIATAGKGVTLDPIVLASLAPVHLAAAHDLASLVGGIEVITFVQQGGAPTTSCRWRRSDSN